MPGYQLVKQNYYNLKW